MKNVIAMLFVCVLTCLANTQAHAADLPYNPNANSDPYGKQETIAITVITAALATYLFVPSVQEKVNNFFVSQDKQGTVVMGVSKSF